MQTKYARDLTKKTRKMTLEISAEDLEGLPETLRQEFFRAEYRLHHPAQILSVWARIFGLQPADPQGELELEGATEAEIDGALTPS
jgi:hypothetical protein